MTVAALPSTASYIEDGATTAFPVPFRFGDASDLMVERVAGGAATLLALGVDYTVVGGSTDAGGTLTRVAATSGATLRISRRTARAQPMVYNANDRFPAKSHEQALDRQMLVAQELDAAVLDVTARSLMLPPGEVAPDLPAAAARRGQVLMFDRDTGALSLKLEALFAPGAAGAAANTRQSLAELKAAKISDLTSLYDGSAWFFEQGDFSATPVEPLYVTIAKADSVDLSQGAWARQRARGIVYAAPGGMARPLDEKVAELGVSIVDHGGVPNVDSVAAANANKMALARAFAKSPVVFVPGDDATFYAMGSSPQIPDGYTLTGSGAILRMKGEGIRLGDASRFLRLGLTGLLPHVAMGTLGSGVPGRTTPTPNSQQYALLYADGKTGCVVEITYLADAPINGVQANNGRHHRIIVERAENIGHDGVFSPTEGAIIYAPATTDSLLSVRDGGQFYGLGGIMVSQSTRNFFPDVFLHDTRRGGIHNAGGSGLPSPGPGNVILNPRFERIGGITPTIPNPPFNHWQGASAIFFIGAAKPEHVRVLSATVINYQENGFEGTMEIVDPTVEVTRDENGVFWDEGRLAPNPGVFYGSQRVIGGTVNSGRGHVFAAGGEAGALITDILVDGLTINNPRRAIINGELTRPSFVRIQVDGPGNVADNVVVQNCVGFDTTGSVEVGFVVAATSGASFSNTCHVTGNKSSVSAHNISPTIRQLGNSWQLQARVAAPAGGATVDAEARTAIASLRDAMIGAGIMSAS